MNSVADESRAGPVIRALREAGHDVVAIAEVAKGATDEDVLDRALNEKRVLITRIYRLLLSWTCTTVTQLQGLTLPLDGTDLGVAL